MVLHYLGFRLSNASINKLVNGEPGAIEFILYRLREKIEQAVQERRFRPTKKRSRSAASRGNSMQYTV